MRSTIARLKYHRSAKSRETTIHDGWRPREERTPCGGSRETAGGRRPRARAPPWMRSTIARLKYHRSAKSRETTIHDGWRPREERTPCGGSRETAGGRRPRARAPPWMRSTIARLKYHRSAKSRETTIHDGWRPREERTPCGGSRETAGGRRPRARAPPWMRSTIARLKYHRSAKSRETTIHDGWRPREERTPCGGSRETAGGRRPRARAPPGRAASTLQGRF